MISTGIQIFDTPNFDHVLNLHGVVGKNYNYQGYPELSHLYSINKIFSDKPWGEIVDRSGCTAYPFKLKIRLPWTAPSKAMDLDTVCDHTVQNIITANPAPYYIYWSGGIDSHLTLVSFLRSVDHNDIVVLLSEGSIVENPYFYENFIKNKLQTMDSKLPSPPGGTHITGDCGDTIWAILDESFLNNPTIRNYLYRPWREYFIKINPNPDFLQYCEQFMSRSQREITTLFEARWWFYLLCKSQSKAVYKHTTVLLDSGDVNLVNFYENTLFENWSYMNTDKIINGFDWKTYKWPAKEIIYKFDQNRDYLVNKSKGFSNHVIGYKVVRNLNINLDMPLFITDTNEKPTLSTEPFFSAAEYRQQYYSKYQHLFQS